MNRNMGMTLMNGIRVVVLLGALTAAGLGQSVVLNEMMSANSATLTDEDGDYPDWIELYHPGPAALNLGGWGLSDDTTDAFKWVFPPVTIPAGGHLLLFASGKDRTVGAGHWETVIDQGDIWRYRVGTVAPPANWMAPGFDDQTWSSGPSGLGYGDGDDATVVPSTLSLFIRARFSVADTAAIRHLLLNVDYDDAFVAYLNGVEIARAGIGVTGTPPAHDQSADGQHEARIYQGGLPERFETAGARALLVPGDNILAVQVHNAGATSSDLSIIPFLTLGMNAAPPNPRGVSPLVEPFLPALHTNFRIAADGETVMLSDPAGTPVDRRASGYIPPDISLGRQPDGAGDWFYFAQPTPGEANTTVGVGAILPDPQFSHSGGFHVTPIDLALTGAEPGQYIRYSTDGSDPDATSNLYTQPIHINRTTVVRAKVFGSGLPGRIVTHSYLFETPPAHLPVVAIAGTPAHFWDNDSGIYVMGPNADPNFPFFGANFWQDWERPVNVELFETDGTTGLNAGAGVKIFGGWSRGHAQKSLSLFARGKYGAGSFDAAIFPGLPLASFEGLVLRNSGNDWQNTMLRDGLMTGLLAGSRVDYQAFRPTVVYLNGEYWGIHNLREKVNEHLVAAHHGLDPDRIDLLELDGQVIEGTNQDYLELLDYIASHDIRIPGYYAAVAARMDIGNYIEYQAAQIYFDNTDWPGNNIKFWKSQDPGGRWRWIMYDTDFGFALFDFGAYANNTLAFALEPNGPDWPNPPWSTYLFRTLVQNTEFRHAFINRMADFLNTRFAPAAVHARLDSLRALIAPEMPDHIQRWGGLSMTVWEANLRRMRTFASLRPVNLHNHIMSEFNISRAEQVLLDVAPANGGTIRINTVVPEQYPWSGYYFNGVPVELTAQAAPGYRFAGWSGAGPADSLTIVLPMTGGAQVTAAFAPDSGAAGAVVINEINYNSDETVFNPEDWVELYNGSGAAVDLTGWQFRDEDDSHIFTLPAGTTLAADGYLVICVDTTLFTAAFPTVENFVGETGFGLAGGGELVRLYDGTGAIVDSLTYDDAAPWPTEPDGNGPTLALKNPVWDNAVPQSWAASTGNGTPGARNSDVFVTGLTPEEGGAALPTRFGVEQNYPNPFNGRTIIRYGLPTRARVSVTLYNILGERVKAWPETVREAGSHAVAWDGVSDGGAMAASGMYVYVVRARSGAGEWRAVRKLLLVR